jgi:hypothetical protein
MDEAGERTFTCDVCGGVFMSGWSEEEAVAEKERLWGDIPLEECGTVCDDCFEQVLELALADWR